MFGCVQSIQSNTISSNAQTVCDGKLCVSQMPLAHAQKTTSMFRCAQIQSINGFLKRSNCLGWEALCTSNDSSLYPAEEGVNVRVRTIIVNTWFPQTLGFSLLESSPSFCKSNDSSSCPEDDVNRRVRTINAVKTRFSQTLSLALKERSCKSYDSSPCSGCIQSIQSMDGFLKCSNCL